MHQQPVALQRRHQRFDIRGKLGQGERRQGHGDQRHSESVQGRQPVAAIQPVAQGNQNPGKEQQGLIGVRERQPARGARPRAERRRVGQEPQPHRPQARPAEPLATADGQADEEQGRDQIENRGGADPVGEGHVGFLASLSPMAARQRSNSRSKSSGCRLYRPVKESSVPSGPRRTSARILRCDT